TTPWTLPANTGISVHPEYDYVLLETGNEKYLVAKGLWETVAETVGWGQCSVLKEVKGKQLEFITCRHPFIERESLVVLGEHVTLEAGTGCVHTAPGHGEDDFYVGKEYGLEVISPVDDGGRFTSEASQFAGKPVHESNQDIITELRQNNMLVNASKIKHQYPHCWRCKNPIIYRATQQWFASISGFRDTALAEIDKVEWIPAWGRDRIYNMVRDRGDWCISRQRTWGVPIPIFYCQSCGHSIINDTTIARLAGLFAEHGSDIWFMKEAAELLPPGYKCECGGEEFTKETDIMDVWFDSGSSHMAVLEQRKDLQWPADLYLEGSDQHRGWFNSSLSTAVAVKAQAPYRTVLTHGFVVDEQGRKMSKSLGNVVDPLKLIKELGADILRLWVSSADYRTDVSVSENIIKQSSEAYRKIRNTCRFILGNLYDFDPDKDQVEYEQLAELDKWALARLDRLIRRVTNAYENYEFHIVFHSIHNFCTIDLSNIYFDILKDNLYCSKPDDPARKAAQTVMYQIINTMVVMLAPILAFTSEEIWQHLRKGNQPISVQLLEWPKPKDVFSNPEIEDKFAQLIEIREVVTKALEEARREKIIGHSLGARVIIYADPDRVQVLNSTCNLDKFFIVSDLQVKGTDEAPQKTIKADGIEAVYISVEPAPGKKCERCWIITPTTGMDPLHPTLCQRCADVVTGLGIQEG
ncbi:MAG: isoleucine--tRNA ligase, partial [Syntrophomonadaceae bacterium]|nr:isoleucine--tRNA ligase [Syntrophomonadaceae bacterium]